MDFRGESLRAGSGEAIGSDSRPGAVCGGSLQIRQVPSPSMVRSTTTTKHVVPSSPLAFREDSLSLPAAIGGSKCLSVPCYRFDNIKNGLDAAVEQMQHTSTVLKQLFEDGWPNQAFVPTEHVYELLWRMREISVSLDEASYRGLMVMEEPNPPDIEDWWDDEDDYYKRSFSDAKWAEENDVDLDEIYDCGI